MFLVALACACGGHDDGASAPTTGSGSVGSAVGSAEEPAPHDRELVALWELEKKRRGEIDFAKQPPSDGQLGPDPYRIARIGSTRFGLLRGESDLVALDATGKELGRARAPRSPSGIATSVDGDVLVVGEGARELAQFRFDGGKLERVATLPIAALGMRDVALSPDGKTAFIVEELEGRLLAVSLAKQGRALRQTGVRELSRCHGPIQVETTGNVVAINCLLDRTIEVRVEPRPGGSLGVPVRLQHDGPFWSFALHREADGKILVAAGGVEDHPLERADGGFGYIDSYLYVYRLASGTLPTKLASINVSELGAITPKWVRIHGNDEGVSVTTAGYGSPLKFTIGWPERDFTKRPNVIETGFPPGTTSVDVGDDGTLFAANPLLDVWVVARDLDVQLVPTPHSRRTPGRTIESRIGELLFFTNMMAPWSGTEGKRSRFTCETCHHEGYGDGRTHFTGREESGVKVHATTRPLLGLFNNAPYFSRALDLTITQMVHSEFKVANRHNGRDPWFELTLRDLPWLKDVEGVPDRLSAEKLREAFMHFLIDFTHRANPAADHATFTDLERRGAETFRDRCASCHAARLIAEEPTTEVPFDRWEKLTLSPSGPIVWNNAAYAKTNVTPYVHPDGTRVPSLRRLYKKWPYFTSGSAKSLAELLDRFAANEQRAFHDKAPANATLKHLTDDEKAALLAFLAIL